MSTPSYDYPAPSAQETRLLQKQIDALEQQMAYYNAWEPILTGEMGYKYDEAGNLVKLTEGEQLAGMTETERQAYDIQKLANEQELKAMRGELEISPTTEASIKEAGLTTAERMAAQLGSGWETSSAGIRAMAEQGQAAAELREAVRTGEMTNAEAIAQSRSAQSQSNLERLIRNQQSRTETGAGLVSAYESPINWYERQRAGKFQGTQLGAQLKSQQMGQISGAATSEGCCFHFMEAEDNIPDEVKRLRDLLYDENDNVARGYRIMARKLVPMMRKHPDIKEWVRDNMTQPITKYAEWFYGKNTYGYFYQPVCERWEALWKKIGRMGGKEYTWGEFYN